MTSKEIFGSLLIITGIFDAFKYTVQSNKIRKNKSAQNISRKFINWALMNDLIKMGYGIVINDFFIFITSLIALGCMVDMWIQIYRFYPYRMRGCYNFRRPNIFIYFINSLLPNHLRRRL